jgi:hypothetical protein
MRNRLVMIALSVATFLALNVVPGLAVYRPGH